MPLQIRTISFVLCAAVFSCLFTSSSQGESLALDPGQLPTSHLNALDIAGKLPLTERAYFLEDPQGLYGIEEMLAGKFYGAFERLGANTFNAGITTSVYWFYVKLQYPGVEGDIAIKRLLEIAYPPLDNITVYIIDRATQELNIFEAGDGKIFSTRPIRHNNYLFPITLLPNSEKEVFVQINSKGSMRIPISLWTAEAFYETDRSYLLLIGLYFGIMFLMFFYNACIYVVIRDNSYLYYILYIGFLTVFQSTINGFTAEYLWPETPYFNDDFLMSVIFCVNLFAMMFARRLLDTKSLAPNIDKVFLSVGFIAITGIPCAFILPYIFILKVATGLSMFLPIFAIIAGLSLSLKGDRTAKLFMLAWSAFLLGAVTFGATAAGLLPANAFTTNSLLVGSAIEASLLSLTLADRFSSMQREKTFMQTQAKDALQKVNEVLLENNKLKDDFLATISHELRTPMNGVISCLNHLKHEDDKNMRDRYLENADQSAHHMMLLIDGVLSYTELQTGDIHLNLEAFKLSRITEELTSFFTQQCEEKNIDFNINVKPAVPSLLIGDQRRILQVLIHLIDNAVKFTRSGYVRLTIDIATLNNKEKTATLTFSVEDSGSGIPMDMRDAIFDRFRQVDGSFSRGHGGLGIGLSICKQIANIMHGELHYKAGAIQGSVFQFEVALGFESSANQPSDTAQYSLDSLAKGRTALVIEDNPVNQMVLRATLKKIGFQVLTAENGEVGLETLHNNVVDIILMDCQMPVLDGFEATMMIRALESPKALVPIIAITANAMSKDRERCMVAGMNDYMSKPVNNTELQEKLLKWLPVGISASEAPTQPSNIIPLQKR